MIARAIVRDLYSGAELARFFALLMLVNGLGPILAPIAGAQLLAVTSWRGIFLVLAAFGLVLLVAAAAGLRETLPPERRHGGGLAADLARVPRAGGRPRVHRLRAGVRVRVRRRCSPTSPARRSCCRRSTACRRRASARRSRSTRAGSWRWARSSSRLVARTGPARLLKRRAALVQLTGAAGLLASVLSGAGLAALLVSLFAVVSSIGLVLPNATALALADHPRTAGSASALLGLAQFLFGAIAAPLVGIGGTGTAVPMAVVIAVAAAAAGVAAYSTAA